MNLLIDEVVDKGLTIKLLLNKRNNKVITKSKFLVKTNPNFSISNI